MFSNAKSPEERLHAWREIRKITDHQGLLDAFATIPITPRYLDFYTPASWPNVFDIVSEGQFCQSGISLVMAATLENAGFISSAKITFPVISNNTNGNTGLVFIHDDKVYNFLPGQTIPLKTLEENSTIYTFHDVQISTLFN